MPYAYVSRRRRRRRRSGNDGADTGLHDTKTPRNSNIMGTVPAGRHAHSIVHLDVKSPNFLVSKGVVKLADLENSVVTTEGAVPGCLLSKHDAPGSLLSKHDAASRTTRESQARPCVQMPGVFALRKAFF